MIYLVSNGHDKVKIGWSERAKIDDEYPRLKEYISYNPDTEIIDIVEHGTKEDEKVLKELTARFYVPTKGQREWRYDNDQVREIWNTYKEVIETRWKSWVQDQIAKFQEEQGEKEE